jgi:thymidylate synthase
VTQFDRLYRRALAQILAEGKEELNERTGRQIKSLPGLTLEIDAGFPLLTLRKIPIRIFVAEQVWFLTGSNRPEPFLRHFTKIWDDFTEDDGTVAAAYGHRWRRHFGRDQIGLLLKHLTRDPSSRQGVVIIWDAAGDSLESPHPKKNNPCPIAFIANIIDKALNLHLIIRSEDMILGCPHDVGGFALLQRLLAAKLDAPPGKLTVSISHAHIYDVHYEAAAALSRRCHDHAEISLEVSAEDFDRAERGDAEVVREITARLDEQYHPLPPLKLARAVVGEPR